MTDTSERRITLFRCAGNAKWNAENAENAVTDPAQTYVLWRCGDGATNETCDCPAVTFEVVSEPAA